MLGRHKWNTCMHNKQTNALHHTSTGCRHTQAVMTAGHSTLNPYCFAFVEG